MEMMNKCPCCPRGMKHRTRTICNTCWYECGRSPLSKSLHGMAYWEFLQAKAMKELKPFNLEVNDEYDRICNQTARHGKI